MKAYLASLALGLLAGVIYALFDVRSPAPPVIALIGLLGMLLGEQIPPLVKHLWSQQPLAAMMSRQVVPHMFGTLPECLDKTLADDEARLSARQSDKEA